MDMTRDALQYVVGLKTAEVLDINGERYVDKDVYRVDNELRASGRKNVGAGRFSYESKSALDAGCRPET